MELGEYARIIRKNWVLVIITTILGLGLGAGASLLATPQYQSSTQVYVSTRAGEGSTGELVSGAEFSRQMINSYVTVITSGVVLDPVVERLNLDMTGEELADYVLASSPTDSTLIDIYAVSSSAEQSALIANTVRESFNEVVVSQLETSGPGEGSPVRLTTTQNAVAPSSPISPNITLNLLLGILGGVAVGLGIAILRGAFDNRLHSVRDIQAVTDVPVIGGILENLNEDEDKFIVRTVSNSPRTESYRTLRTNLQFLNVDSDRRVFVVTSSNANEGKTTTALNLALTLARAGERVAVVEGDLRKPVFADYLEIEGGAGLTDVLIGRADLEDVLQRWGTDQFYVLPAGRIPPNPSELLGTDGMSETIRALESRFDYVIIDAPPVLAVSDAAILGKLALGILMVVAAGSTTEPKLEAALERLDTSQNQVLGIVATMLSAKGTESQHYYSSYGDLPEEHLEELNESPAKGEGVHQLRRTSHDK